MARPFASRCVLGPVILLDGMCLVSAHRGMDEDSVLAHLRASPDRLHTLPEIAKRLNVPPEKTKSLRRILKGLVKRGDLERERGRAFRISRAGQETEGRVVFDDEGVA